MCIYIYISIHICMYIYIYAYNKTIFALTPYRNIYNYGIIYGYTWIYIGFHQLYRAETDSKYSF